MNKPSRHLRACLATVSLISTLLAPAAGFGQQPATGDGDWYYELGGASPISPSPNVNAVSIPLVGSVGLQLPRSCGALDPVIAISNSLGAVGAGADQLDDLLVLAATEAIAALPAIILQRANPGLYEHFQGALQKAEAAYEFSVKSCEQHVEDFENGRNPLGGWVKKSKGETWQQLLAAEDADSIAAEAEVDTLNGDEGVLWLNGDRRGGLDQEPLPVIREAAQAGYNLILGRDVDDGGAPNVDGARLSELFETAEEAGEFAAEVLGDHVIQTCQGCTPGTVAATGGLLKAIDVERDLLLEGLLVLIDGDESPTEDELREISADNAIVTAQLLEDFRAIEEEQDRLVLAEHMAASMALSRVSEQGLKLRQMLLTSLQIPEIADNGLATDVINQKLSHLKRTMDELLYESTIQAQLISNTAGITGTLADRARLRSVGAQNRPNKGPDDQLLQGRLREEE